jgi:cytochrome c biogenesis protein CcmG/thiol:disulfide interchange protein DsbE
VGLCHALLFTAIRNVQTYQFTAEEQLLVKISKQFAMTICVCLIVTVVLSACNPSNHPNSEKSLSLPTKAKSLSQALNTAIEQPDSTPTPSSIGQSITATQVVAISSPIPTDAPQISSSPTPAPVQAPQEPTATLAGPTSQASAVQANGSQPAAKAPGVPEKPEVGFAAPGFSLTTLDGKTIQLSDLRGKDVLINYWVTWCIPCKEELPVLDKLGQEYGPKGVTVLSIDGIQQDTLGDVQSIVGQLGLTYPVLLDEGNSFSKAYWVKFMPTSIFIDKQGIIRFIQLGSTTEENFRAKIEEMLSSQS